MSKYTNTINSLFILSVMVIGVLFMSQGIILQAGLMSVVDILFGILLFTVGGLAHCIISSVPRVA